LFCGDTIAFLARPRYKRVTIDYASHLGRYNRLSCAFEIFGDWIAFGVQKMAINGYFLNINNAVDLLSY
jgi:hypothetical protein